MSRLVSGKWRHVEKISVPLEKVTSVKYWTSKGKFPDTKMVRCTSGAGGNGCAAFAKDANKAKGPPSGGDGGDGGSIWVEATPDVSSLEKLNTSYTATRGSNGQSDCLYGARGKDVIIKVPLGTEVKFCLDPKIIRNIISERKQLYPTINELLAQETVHLPVDSSGNIQLDRGIPNDWIFKDKTAEYHYDKSWFTEFNRKMKRNDRSATIQEQNEDTFPLQGRDMDHIARFCLLNGGGGGLGNAHFTTSLIRNPRFAKPGRLGISAWFLLEMKLMADIGLIGLPNSGKSTLLNCISNANSEVGHWEFTTLKPVLGTVTHPDLKNITVADIPGIIEDAHLNKGMGLEFLRHIQRSKCWCFVINLANADPIAELNLLMKEVGGKQEIMKRNIVVIGNKADIACDAAGNTSQHKYQILEQYCQENQWECIPTSALNNHNTDLLIAKIKAIHSTAT